MARPAAPGNSEDRLRARLAGRNRQPGRGARTPPFCHLAGAAGGASPESTVFSHGLEEDRAVSGARRLRRPAPPAGRSRRPGRGARTPPFRHLALSGRRWRCKPGGHCLHTGSERIVPSAASRGFREASRAWPHGTRRPRARDRDARIRTGGLLLPKQARYQAAPRPVTCSLRRRAPCPCAPPQRGGGQAPPRSCLTRVSAPVARPASRHATRRGRPGESVPSDPRSEAPARAG